VPYRIDISPAAESHLRVLTARRQRVLFDAIEAQLPHQPTAETRNRKMLRPNPIAEWELRVGDLRVYYDVEEAPEQVVRVRAVGVKNRDEVRIAGRIVKL
jgi:mRNA-degrading endonuclease RelE of RelBE toxin-antitoxin system